MRLRAGSLIQFGVVVVLAVVPWWYVLSLPMTTCDAWPIINSAGNSSWGQLLSSRLMEGTAFKFDYFRPVVMLSFRVNYALGGLDPWIYHATNLSTHVLASVFLWLVLRRLSAGLLPLVATLIFLAHPVLVEVIPGVARRSDLLMGMFGLATCYAALRALAASGIMGRRLWVAATILLFFLTTLSKDYGVVFMLPLMVFHFGLGSRRLWLMPTGVGVVVVLWFLLRSWALQGVTIPLSPSHIEFFAMCNYALFGLFPLAAELLLLVLTVYLVAIVVVIVTARKDETEQHQAIPPDAMVLLFGLCLAVPIMTVMAVVGRFTVFYGYVPVMGFAVLSGYFLVRAKSLISEQSDRARRAGGIAGGIIALSMTLWMAAHLTWFVRYEGWAVANHIGQDYLDQLGQLVDELPERNAIVCVDIPRHYRPRGKLVVQSCPILQDYTIASWLRLTRPGRPWHVVTGALVDFYDPPRKAVVACMNPGRAAVFRCRIERAFGWLLPPFKSPPGAPSVSDATRAGSAVVVDVELDHGATTPLAVVYQTEALQVWPL